MDKYFVANAVLSVFSKNYMDLKKGLPIRPSEMGVLNIISETEGPHTPVILAEMLKVSKPMITAHIISLENKGYITKNPSPQDKRAYYILPTEKAKALVKKAKADLTHKLDWLIDGLGQDDFNALVALAEKANKIMETSEAEYNE
ncbi:MAG: MarR family transcriptional regulator [Anaeroplasmataceae bacterium]|nr:MarR family transcriptional regulator [Anaeroplasmataceae bacterium]